MLDKTQVEQGSIAPRGKPEGVPHFKSPPLKSVRPPRCPPFVEVTDPDQLLPYLEHVAKRPYNHGLNACWDLQPGERVLLRVDNWHSDMVIQACQKILEKYNVVYEIKKIDRGPIPQWVGSDEVQYYLRRTKELAEWMDMWEEIEEASEAGQVPWRALFTRPNLRKRVFIASWLQWAQQFTGMNAIIMNSSNVFRALGFDDPFLIT